MSRTAGGAYQSGGKPVEKLKPPPKGPGSGNDWPTSWVPDYWLIITKRWFRWHWELRNLVGVKWASGTARSFEQAREAGEVRAKIGPTHYLPERPNPGIPEAWPKVNHVPIKVRHSDGSKEETT